MKKIDIISIYQSHIRQLEDKSNFWLLLNDTFNKEIEGKINILHNAIRRVKEGREKGEEYEKTNGQNPYQTRY